MTKENIAIEHLLANLDDRYPDRCIAAIQELRTFGEHAPLEPLLCLLTNEWQDVREAAARAIEDVKPWITEEHLLAALHTSACKAYIAAIDVLTTLGEQAPLEPLLAALQHKNQCVRYRAIRALGKMPTRLPMTALVQRLAPALHHDNPAVRIEGIEYLSALGDNVPAELFLEALYDAEPEVREAALWTLEHRGKQGKPLPLEPLEAVLLHDTAGEVRECAIRVLATQGERTPINLLIAALHDQDEDVVFVAAQTLGKIKALPAILPLLTILSTCSDGARFGVQYALMMLREHVPVEPLLEALHNEKWAVRQTAVGLLGIMGERVPVESLLAALHDKNATVRAKAVTALGHHQARIPVEPLVKALCDRNKWVRRQAADRLLQFKDCIPPELLLPLLDTPEAVARMAAIRLLGKRAPFERLIVALRDRKWTVREAALEVLGTLGDQAPLVLLQEALSDKNLRVRRAAILALGNLGERTPIVLIVDALHDRRQVSSAAVEVLEKLGERIPLELLLSALLDEMPHVRMLAAQLLNTCKQEKHTVFPIVEALAMKVDEPEEVRLQAIHTLAASNPLLSVEPLVGALNDPNWRIRMAALEALVRLKEQAPLEPLLAMLGDNEVYHTAISALTQTHPDALIDIAAEASEILLGRSSGSVLGSLVQCHIAETTGNMKNASPLLVNKLVELLDWPYWEVRAKADQALKKLRHGIPDPINPDLD